ncbi:MAG TPA: hypothetical protein VEK37_09400 [Gemmatimonadaceae bacterium]|nr:hypothetical protein [Gemmatimonadaceae bacterium]
MKLPPLDPRDYQDIVRRALDEDLIDAAGDAKDVTAEATVPAAARARGRFVMNADCVATGLDVAFECFRALEPEAEMTVHRGDGATAKTAKALGFTFSRLCLSRGRVSQ